jgi:hypothetical protein
MVALLYPAVEKVREAAARAATANNLRQIAVGIHTYNDQNKSLPAHAIYSKNDKTPLLSWRVSLLPYFGHEALYLQFKLDEPWDSEHNKRLIPKMPAIYAKPGEEPKDGLTNYQVFTGPGAVFDGPKKLRFDEISQGDGTTNTLLVVMSTDPVVWTKPADLVLPPRRWQDAIPQRLGPRFCTGFFVRRQRPDRPPKPRPCPASGNSHVQWQGGSRLEQNRKMSAIPNCGH